MYWIYLQLHKSRFEAFNVTKIATVFSGDQPCQFRVQVLKYVILLWCLWEKSRQNPSKHNYVKFTT
jgi:hypothetical protein